MAVNTEVLLLLLREVEWNLAFGQVKREDVVAANDTVLAMVHQAGVSISPSPTIGEVRKALKRALELPSRINLICG